MGEDALVKGNSICKAKDLGQGDVFKELSTVQFCSRIKCEISLERWWVGGGCQLQKGLASQRKIFSCEPPD